MDHYDTPESTRVMTRGVPLTALMEFALFALFACSLASVIATVFRGQY